MSELARRGGSRDKGDDRKEEGEEDSARHECWEDCVAEKRSGHETVHRWVCVRVGDRAGMRVSDQGVEGKRDEGGGGGCST